MISFLLDEGLWGFNSSTGGLGLPLEPFALSEKTCFNSSTGGLGQKVFLSKVLIKPRFNSSTGGLGRFCVFQCFF